MDKDYHEIIQKVLIEQVKMFIYPIKLIAHP